MKKRFFFSGVSLLLVLLLLVPILPVRAEESQCEHVFRCPVGHISCDCEIPCSLCGAYCEHQWDEGGWCLQCEAVCQHRQWNENVCTVCGAQCGVIWDHSFDNNGVCMCCGVTCSHEWNGYGSCSICGAYCYHEQWIDAVCTNCGYQCTCRLYLDASIYVDGVCMRCNTPCAHVYMDEVCFICHMSCSHCWMNGYCRDCGKVCQHSFIDGVCELCTAEADKLGYACLSGDFNNWAYELNMTPVTQRYLGTFVELDAPTVEEFTLYYQGDYWGTSYDQSIGDIWNPAVKLEWNKTLKLRFPQGISGRYLVLFDIIAMKMIVCYYPEQMYVDLGTGVLYPMETDGMGYFKCTVTLEPGHYPISHTDGGDFVYRWDDYFDLNLTRRVDVTISFQQFWYTADDGTNYTAGLGHHVPPCEHSWVDGTCEICAKVCSHKWKDGTCTTCGEVCYHSYEEGVCVGCGAACVHEWMSYGECMYCGLQCSHEQFDAGICTTCGFSCEEYGSHEYDQGVCTVCGQACDHQWDEIGYCHRCYFWCEHEQWKDSLCVLCGYACVCYENPSSYLYENGVCYRCGTPCKHEGAEGICSICNTHYPHQWMNGYCSGCDAVCEHNFMDGVCRLCNAEEEKLGYASLSGAFNDWAFALNMAPFSQRYLSAYIELESPVEEDFALYYMGEYWGFYGSNYIGDEYCNSISLSSGIDTMHLTFPQGCSGRYLFFFDTVEMKLIVCYSPEQMYMDFGNGVLYPMETDGLGYYVCTATLEPGTYTPSHTDGKSYTYRWKEQFDFELYQTAQVKFSFRKFNRMDDETGGYASFYSSNVPPCTHSWAGGICELCKAQCNHQWEAGLCTTCGMAQAPVLTLKYPTVSFEDEVKMNIYFSAEDTDGVEQMGLALYDNALRTAEGAQLVEGYTYDEGAGLYAAATPGIAAKNLSNNLTFSVYALLKDGTYVYTNPISYSPQNYALSMINNENADPALKAATVSMLSYSGAAQTYFGEEASAGLTEDMLSLIESYRDDMLQEVQKPTTEMLGTFVSNGGFSGQYPTISFEGAFSINYYFAPNYGVEGDMKLYVWNRDDYEAAEELTKENASRVLTMTPGDAYSAAVTDIAAKELDSTVYVAAVYSDGTNEYCSGVLAYSIGAYCRSQVSKGTQAMKNLAAAVAVYGYYAKNYFG